MPDDAGWMATALALAERARDLTAPNPMVGCVLVRDGRLLAEGWTQPAGGQHAEAMALARTADARGATAYVTLEPCAHTGRTPPCADALLAAGVTRVVVATADPHALAAGGAQRLRAAGVEVVEGVLEAWAVRQLAPFLTSMTRGRPLLTLKLAQTLDGRLSAPTSRWVTGPASRRAVHRLRSRVDAVLVGSGTVLADDPRLDVRDAPTRRGQPRAVVLDARGRTPDTARVARPDTVVVTASGDPRWEERLRARGVEVVRVAPGAPGGVELASTMQVLWHDLGIQSVLAEPGETLAGALLAADVVDRVVRHVATTVHADDGRARIVAALAPSARWPLARWVQRGPDLEVVADRPGP